MYSDERMYLGNNATRAYSWRDVGDDAQMAAMWGLSRMAKYVARHARDEETPNERSARLLREWGMRMARRT